MDQQEAIFRRTLRLPQDAANFVSAEARRNMTSENAEIVRSIRERMQAATGEGFADTAPAAVTKTDALAGVNSHQPRF
jgi:hypothetical protein